jgi:Protein of unknown function (DUF3738)
MSLWVQCNDYYCPDLKGCFDFQIEWPPEETLDSAQPSLFTVLKEQLGLKLQTAKSATETLVIDQITNPSVNKPAFVVIFALEGREFLWRLAVFGTISMLWHYVIPEHLRVGR